MWCNVVHSYSSRSKELVFEYNSRSKELVFVYNMSTPPQNTILHLPLSNESIAFLHQNNSSILTSSAPLGSGLTTGILDDTTIATYPPDSTINPSEYEKLLGDKIKERQANLDKRTSDMGTVISSSFKVSDTSVKFIHEYSLMREFEWCNAQGCLPDKTSVCCWWDTKKFPGRPVCIPIRHNVTNNTEHTFHVIGNFCSFQCAKAYIRYGDTSILGAQYVSVCNSMPLLKLFYDTCYSVASSPGYKFDNIPCAPPRQALISFGGVMDINTFRGVIDDFTVTISPVISVIPKLIQTYTNVSEAQDTGSADAQFAHIPGSFDDTYRLKRCKPKPNSNNVLATYFNKLNATNM